MEKIKNIINRKKQLENIPLTVNSNKRDKPTVNSRTVNSKSVEEEIEEVIQRHQIEPEGVAQMIAQELGDMKSLKYYQLLAKENNTAKLLEALSLTKEASRKGEIKSKPVFYFKGILNKWKFKTRFKT